jgi:L-lactate dehydrogenase (cytochrome)
MDATEEYEVSILDRSQDQPDSRLQPIHPPDAIKENLGRFAPDNNTLAYACCQDPSKHLGALIPNTLPKPAVKSEPPAPASIAVPQKTTSGSGDPEPEEYIKPDIEEILSLHDFEAVARRTMTRRGWNYYSS